MENRNHMKIFPPTSQFLFWFKPIKQNNSNSKKICLFRRSQNVEKKIPSTIPNKNISNITPEENTTGETVMPFHLIKTQSRSNKKGIQKIIKSIKPPLSFFVGIISIFLYKARKEFETVLIVGFAKTQPCI